MKICILIATITLVASSAFAANPNDVLGPWKTAGDSSALEIFNCGDKLCGKVIWLKNPNYVSSKDGPVGKQKVDLKNPDPALRQRPIVGLKVIEGLTPVGANQWENGSCYDPESGNHYQCKIRLESSDRLEVRGFIGLSLFGRTYVLTRKEKVASSKGNSPHP